MCTSKTGDVSFVQLERTEDEKNTHIICENCKIDIEWRLQFLKLFTAW